MKKISVFLAILLLAIQAMAQTTSTDSLNAEPYHETATRINDLVHTKLDVRFDFNKSWLYGKAWITLKPHFYSTRSF